MGDLQAQHLGKKLSMKAISRVRNIYKSRRHVETRTVRHASLHDCEGLTLSAAVSKFNELNCLDRLPEV